MQEIPFEADAHVRAWYDEPADSSSKFEGERRAVEAAYEMSLNGFVHDDFGDVDTGGYYARILFDCAPFIVCFVVCSQGFVSEVSPREYEDIWTSWVEDCEARQEAGEDVYC